MGEISCPQCFTTIKHDDSGDQITCMECGRQFSPEGEEEEAVDEIPSMDALIELQEKQGSSESGQSQPEEQFATLESEGDGGVGEPVVEKLPDPEPGLEGGLEADSTSDESFGLEEQLPTPDSLGEPEESPTEPSLLNEAPMTDEIEPQTQGDEGAFQESEGVFQELREYGEGLMDENAPAPSAAAKPAKKAAAPKSKAAPRPVAVPAAGVSAKPAEGPIVVQEASVPGYHTILYYLPVSVCEAFDPQTKDPLSPAFATLWKRSSSLGANAVVGMKWSFSPDGSHLVVTGTPVQLEPM